MWYLSINLWTSTRKSFLNSLEWSFIVRSEWVHNKRKDLYIWFIRKKLETAVGQQEVQWEWICRFTDYKDQAVVPKTTIVHVGTQNSTKTVGLRKQCWCDHQSEHFKYLTAELQNTTIYYHDSSKSHKVLIQIFHCDTSYPLQSQCAMSCCQFLLHKQKPETKKASLCPYGT